METKKTNIWQISPGYERYDYWPGFLKEGIIAIGWDELGNLLDLNRDDIAKEMKRRYKEGKNSVNSCWKFSRKIKRGDIIVTKKGNSKEIYGIGVAKSEYEFKEERKFFKHVIKVEWFVKFDKRFKVNVDKQFVQWTLNELNEETYEKIKSLILKQFPYMKEKFEDINELSKELKKELEGGEKMPEKIITFEKLHNEGRIEFITFHPSYSYEEFVEGYKPKKVERDPREVDFVLLDGIFKKMCARALASLLNKYDPKNPDNFELEELISELIPDVKKRIFEGFEQMPEYEKRKKSFVLIIDEINRANISKVLGELIYALEYRGEAVRLTYSQKDLIVPPNLYIVGTMNTADTSIALIDIALRRRFGFQEFMPDINRMFKILSDEYGLSEEKIREKLGLDLRGLISIMNQRISTLADREKQVGHTFFLNVFKGDEKTWKSNLKRIWFKEIIPLLQQYFFNDYKRIRMIIGKNFVGERQIKEDKFCKTEDIDDVIDTEEPRYELIINENVDIIEALKSIYIPKTESSVEVSSNETTT